MSIHDPFRYSGPGGISWTHRVVLRNVAASDTVQDCVPGHVTGKILRRVMAGLIGNWVFDNAALHSDRIEKPDHYPMHMEKRLAQASFAVVMPDGGRNWFAEEKERARAQGLRDAGNVAREQADRYGAVSGPCAFVLQNQCNELARRLFDMASDIEGKRSQPMELERDVPSTT